MSPIDDARRQEQRRKAGDLLKMADKLFKSQDFEGAARLVDIAMQTDPKNAYAIAYQERIKHAITQRDQSFAEPTPATPAPTPAAPARTKSPAPAAPNKPATPPAPPPEHLKKKVDDAHRRVDQEKDKVKSRPSPDASPGSKEILQQLEEDLQTQLDMSRTGADGPAKGVKPPHDIPPTVHKELETLRRRLEEQSAQFHIDRDTMRADMERDFKRRLEEERKRFATDAEKALTLARATSDHELQKRLQEEAARIKAEGVKLTEESLARALQEQQARFSAEQDRIQKRLQEDVERAATEARKQAEEAAARTLKAADERFNAERTLLLKQNEEHIAAERKAAEEAKLRSAKALDELRATLTKETREAVAAEYQQKIDKERAAWLAEKTSLVREWEERLRNEIARIRTEGNTALQRTRQELEVGVLRRADQDVASRLSEELARLEVEVRRRIEEEFTKKLQDERQKMEQEKQKLQEDLRRRLDEESGKLATVRKNVEEAMRSQLAQEVRRSEELRRQEQEKFEQRRKQLEEDSRRRLDEDRKKLDTDAATQRARLTAERDEVEQLRLQLEENRQRITSDLFVNRQLERQQLEQQLRGTLTEEFERRLAEERKAAEERHRKAQYEAIEEHRQSEERLRKELEDKHHQKLTEEAERLRAEFRREAEERHGSALDERSQKYEEAVRQAIEEGRRQAQTKKIQAHLEKAKALLGTAQFEEALNEVTKVFRLEPSHLAAQDLERTIYAARDEHRRRQAIPRGPVEHRQQQVEDVQRRFREHEQIELERQEFYRKRDQMVAVHLQNADVFYRQAEYEKALAEVDAALALDPTHAAAKDLEVALLSLKSGQKDLGGVQSWRTHEEALWTREETRRDRAADQSREQITREARLVYSNILRLAWKNGRPSKDNRNMIDVARESLKISPVDHTSIEREMQLEAYRAALEAALTSGGLTFSNVAALEAVREQFGVKPADASTIESLLRSTQSRNR